MGNPNQKGRKKYNATMYEYLLSIKVMFRLPWRATVGFAKKWLSELFGFEVQLPHYAQANREAKKLRLKLKSFSKDLGKRLELAFDSTGLNVYTTSGYHQRRYGKESLCRKKDEKSPKAKR